MDDILSLGEDFYMALKIESIIIGVQRAHLLFKVSFWDTKYLKRHLC